MNVPSFCTALILGGLMAMIAPPAVSQAQSNDKGASVPKNIDAPVPGTATPNTNTNPVKHRHWRHRGGVHPHFGSRRVRT